MAQGTPVTEGSSHCHCEAKGNQVTVGAQLSPNIKQTPRTAGLAVKYATTPWDALLGFASGLTGVWEGKRWAHQ